MKQTKKDSLRVGGVLTAVLVAPIHEMHKAVIRGVPVQQEPVENHSLGSLSLAFKADPSVELATKVQVPEGYAAMCFGGRHNAFVNQGLERLLDLFFNATKGSLSGVSHIGLSADAQPVTATTTSIDPAGGATGTSIKAVTGVLRTLRTTHGEQTWTQADVTWAIRKIGFLYGSAATDVINIIGGAGGSSPYNEDFTIDLVAISAWNLTMGIDVTATAS